MAAIRSKDTKPEVYVRRHVHAAGFRFRLHRRDLPGRPDRFFGVTAEFGSARLKKVIAQTSPVLRNSAIDRLVHLNPDLPGDVIGKNGDLQQMWSLEQMVRDSHNWR